MRIEHVAVVLDEGLAERVDGAQRGAQIVRDRIREGGQLLIGGGEIGGALRHQAFEIGVRLLARAALIAATAVDEVTEEGRGREQERQADERRRVPERKDGTVDVQDVQVRGADDHRGERDDLQALADRGEQQHEEIQVEEVRVELDGCRATRR